MMMLMMMMMIILNVRVTHMPPGSAGGAVGLANWPRGERPASSEKVVAPDSSLLLKFGSLQFLILGLVFNVRVLVFIFGDCCAVWH